MPPETWQDIFWHYGMAAFAEAKWAAERKRLRQGRSVEYVWRAHLDAHKRAAAAEEAAKAEALAFAEETQ